MDEIRVNTNVLEKLIATEQSCRPVAYGNVSVTLNDGDLLSDNIEESLAQVYLKSLKVSHSLLRYFNALVHHENEDIQRIAGPFTPYINDAMMQVSRLYEMDNTYVRPAKGPADKTQAVRSMSNCINITYKLVKTVSTLIAIVINHGIVIPAVDDLFDTMMDFVESDDRMKKNAKLSGEGSTKDESN